MLFGEFNKYPCEFSDNCKCEECERDRLIFAMFEQIVFQLANCEVKE